MARRRTLVKQVQADPVLSEADRQQILDFATWLRSESRRRNATGGATDPSAAPAEKTSSE